MKKLIFLCALSCALFSACQKDCEKDKTSTIKVVNQSTSTAFISLPNGGNKLTLDPGESTSFNFDLYNEFTGLLTAQTSISYKLEGVPENKSVGVQVKQCQVSEVLITN